MTVKAVLQGWLVCRQSMLDIVIHFLLYAYHTSVSAVRAS